MFLGTLSLDFSDLIVVRFEEINKYAVHKKRITHRLPTVNKTILILEEITLDSLAKDIC
jgi:uncharacterized membrane protein SirB2